MYDTARALMLTTNEIRRTIQQAFPLCEVQVRSVGEEEYTYFDIHVHDSFYAHGSWQRAVAATQYFPHLPVPHTLPFLSTEIRQLREILTHVIAEQAGLDASELETVYKVIGKETKINV